MADLNKELNEYLLSSKNEKQFKITVPSVTIPKASIGKWFGRNEDDKEETGWIHGAQKECCPSMVCVTYNIFIKSSLKVNKFCLFHFLADKNTKANSFCRMLFYGCTLFLFISGIHSSSTN